MTATNRFTADSNILIYSADRSSLAKQQIANRIVDALLLNKSPLPLQCLNEFYKIVTQKGHMPAPDAELVARRFISLGQVIPASIDDATRAMALHQHHKIQFFDALLLATAARSGCTLFLSEDLQDNRTYDTITVRNPFLLSPADLTTLLA